MLNWQQINLDSITIAPDSRFGTLVSSVSIQGRDPTHFQVLAGSENGRVYLLDVNQNLEVMDNNVISTSPAYSVDSINLDGGSDEVVFGEEGAVEIVWIDSSLQRLTAIGIPASQLNEMNSNGWAVANIGDVNEDGVSDIVVGVSGGKANISQSVVLTMSLIFIRSNNRTKRYK